MSINCTDDMNQVLNGLKISARCVGFGAHRHLAHYDLSLAPGFSISKIEKSVREIALGIRSKSTPIVKLIPEQGIVRLQVAMKDMETIYLKDMWKDDYLFMKFPLKDENNYMNGSQLFPDHAIKLDMLKDENFDQSLMCPIVLGEDEEGQRVIMDMADNPHLLVAGTTGSGKTVILHTIIGGFYFLKDSGFRQVTSFLFDPKRVEFEEYKNLEGTFVYSTYEETVENFEWLVMKMNQRYEAMADLHMKSMADRPNSCQLINIVVDEVADLFLQDKSKVLQSLIVNIAQKGRAAGYYLTLATQRPSVDVLSGVIKANCPARIACKTASKKDSQVILDYVGAENLLGKGDAIIRNGKHNNVRFQAAYTTASDVVDMFPKFHEKKKTN
jgi:DNA segregation ATPase FtsK/SpoIIIE-like protein